MLPKRLVNSWGNGDLMWVEPTHSRALDMLKNPRYAGVYFYGRGTYIRKPDGRIYCTLRPQDQWTVFLPDSHPGYISLETWNKNMKVLEENSQHWKKHHKNSPPREGSALLQGIAVCGKCGKRMTIQYHRIRDKMYPLYICQSDRLRKGGVICQHINGKVVDNKISELLIKTIQPHSLKLALAIQEQIETREKDILTIQKQQIQKAQYESDLARRRYMSVDPENRLVAESLELEWNIKLRDMNDLKTEFDQKNSKRKHLLSQENKEKIRSLVDDFAAVWNDPGTPVRERKRIVRLIIEDVTLTRAEDFLVQVRFKGGATESFNIPIPLPYCLARKTPSPVIDAIDCLLDHHYNSDIPEILNDKGYRTGDGLPFTTAAVNRIIIAYNLRTHRVRLLERGFLKQKDMLQLLEVGHITLKKWRDKGLIKTRSYGNSYRYILYERPSDSNINKLKTLYRREKLKNFGPKQHKKFKEKQYG